MRTLRTALLVAIAATGLLAWMALPAPAEAIPTGVSCNANGCFNNDTGEIISATGAATAYLEAEVCPSTASAALPANAILANAKSLYLQNRSSATIYASFDAATVTTAGARGFKLAPGDSLSFDINGSTFGSSIRVASTANTTSGACLLAAWFK